MPELTNINLGRAQKATIDLWGTPLEVRYVPQRMTKKLIAQLGTVAEDANKEASTLSDATDGVDVLISTVLMTVVAWDLTLGGKPVELTQAGLEEIDLDILTEILQQLKAKQVPNDLSGMPTNAPS